MTSPLYDAVVGDRRLTVVATGRADGDVHPGRVPPDQLRARQRSITPGRSWTMADQVHGVAVIEVDPDASWTPTHGIADVLVTTARHAPIAVWAADCAPLVLASDDGVLVGAHGGWVGLASGVVDVAVAVATRAGGTVAHAVLGPVIHPCCYAFGAAERATIPDAVVGCASDSSPALDVPATIAASLARHGIRLDVVGPCTGCDDRWFSHRVRAETGRHAVVAEWGTAA